MTPLETMVEAIRAELQRQGRQIGLYYDPHGGYERNDDGEYLDRIDGEIDVPRIALAVMAVLAPGLRP